MDDVLNQQRAIVHALRTDREVSDHAFDSLLPMEARIHSACYWTPVKVAIVASRWLEANGATRVLDIGSGVGKFCTIGAHVTEMAFDGVERRGHLVDVAVTLAAALGTTERTAFITGDLDDVALGDYDGYYLFNPFLEGFFAPRSWLDASVELSPELARADIERVEDTLASLAVGAQVVTYHGYGGRLPDTFHLQHSWAFGGGMLRCWRKQRHGAPGQLLIEADWR